jgi:hypothetical protein
MGLRTARKKPSDASKLVLFPAGVLRSRRKKEWGRDSFGGRRAEGVRDRTMGISRLRDPSTHWTSRRMALRKPKAEADHLNMPPRLHDWPTLRMSWPNAWPGHLVQLDALCRFVRQLDGPRFLPSIRILALFPDRCQVAGSVGLFRGEFTGRSSPPYRGLGGPHSHRVSGMGPL